MIQYIFHLAHKSLPTKLAHGRFISFCTVHPTHRPWKVQCMKQQVTSMRCSRKIRTDKQMTSLHSVYQNIHGIKAQQSEQYWHHFLGWGKTSLRCQRSLQDRQWSLSSPWASWDSECLHCSVCHTSCIQTAKKPGYQIVCHTPWGV